MTPEEYARYLKRRLRNAADTAVRNAAPDVEQDVRKQLPSNRTKTRRAVRGIADGNRLHLQLEFDQRYRQRGSKTEQLMHTAVHRSRPRIVRRLKTQLLNALKR